MELLPGDPVSRQQFSSQHLSLKDDWLGSVLFWKGQTF